jgi:hypothetical protein
MGSFSNISTPDSGVGNTWGHKTQGGGGTFVLAHLFPLLFVLSFMTRSAVDQLLQQLVHSVTGLDVSFVLTM